MNPGRLALQGGLAAVTTPWAPDWPLIGEAEIRAVTGLLERRVLSIYDRSGIVAEFEDAFADYHATADGIPLALSHNSGTSALHAAYFGLALQPGDEVVVPTYTFLATVTPLLHYGVVPVFADIDPVTLTVSPSSVAERITDRTRAIAVTHVWGHPADMPALARIADRHGLPIVEDCSHAHGATLDGRRVGTFGMVACFSLEGHKPMVAGEGGALVTSSRDLYERALMLGHFGRRAKDEVTDARLRPYVETGFGQKYRMHPLAAGIALEQLRKLDAHIAQRGANLDLLVRLLNAVPGIEPPVTLPGATRGGWYGFKARYRPSELGGLPISRFIEALRAEGVQVKRPGSGPLHRQPLFRLTQPEAEKLALPSASFGATPPPLADCPVAEAIYPELLSLPTFSGDCAPVIREYAEAFAKVAHHWQDLL